MKFDEKYKNVTINGSHYPDDPIRNNVKITFEKELMNEYIPTWEKVLKDENKGIKLLCLIMADKEGFYGNSRSRRTNNPGNIGNTDSGNNKQIATLGDGILLQASYIKRIIEGKSKTYPMGKDITIKPFYSKEIAENQKTYAGKSPWLPGYKFKFVGQLDQFVKIYSTGARNGNLYLSQIISFFKNHGITITETTTLQEIANIK